MYLTDERKTGMIRENKMESRERKVGEKKSGRRREEELQRQEHK